MSVAVETCVIGAGVIGLAAARALAISGREVVILEKEACIGMGTSSRNSEVIHSGIYYNRGSHKARLCLEGRSLLYRYCMDRDIPHKAIGKLIVATTKSQMNKDVPQLFQRAHANGVDDVTLLSGYDIQFMEPEVTCIGGLLSPSTGIIDSHSLMVSMLADAEDYGATLALNSPVRKISTQKDSSLSSSGGDDIIVDTDGLQLRCRTLVNCAGLQSDKIQKQLHQQSHVAPWVERSRQFYAKGNYFRLEGVKSPFQRLIYPVPEEGGLGVHATIDLGGMTRFGPDVEWLDADISPDDIDLNVDQTRAKIFYAQIEKYWPGIRDKPHCLSPDYSGVRPKLYHPRFQCDNHSRNTDFQIQDYRHHGVKGFVNLSGIESPGLTSSMAIANTVKDIMNGCDKS